MIVYVPGTSLQRGQSPAEHFPCPSHPEATNCSFEAKYKINRRPRSNATGEVQFLVENRFWIILKKIDFPAVVVYVDNKHLDLPGSTCSGQENQANPELPGLRDEYIYIYWSNRKTILNRVSYDLLSNKNHDRIKSSGNFKKKNRYLSVLQLTLRSS